MSGEIANQFKKSDNPLTIMLEDFCTIGLGMPLFKLHHWERPQEYDAYRIVTVDGLEFVVSGPQLEYFYKHLEDYRKNPYEG